ncbi:hypothetical protein AAC387_Pa01g1652 [Persea americana]
MDEQRGVATIIDDEIGAAANSRVKALRAKSIWTAEIIGEGRRKIQTLKHFVAEDAKRTRIDCYLKRIRYKIRILLWGHLIEFEI